MDCGRKFEVLEGLKIVLKIVEIYPANWIHRNISISIPLIFRPFCASLVLFLFTTLWLCSSFQWDLSLTSGPLCFVFGSSQVLIIYSLILPSKSIVIESTDLLQQLVEQRKFKFELIFLNHQSMTDIFKKN